MAEQHKKHDLEQGKQHKAKMEPTPSKHEDSKTAKRPSQPQPGSKTAKSRSQLQPQPQSACKNFWPENGPQGFQMDLHKEVEMRRRGRNKIEGDDRSKRPNTSHVPKSRFYLAVVSHADEQTGFTHSIVLSAS